MRKKIVAGNWKMNLDWNEAKSLFQSLLDIEKSDVDVIVFPSTPYLTSIIEKKNDVLAVGAQNGYPKSSGAFTGEHSFTQLKSIGVTYALVGHSERRQYFSETNEFLKDKVDACLDLGITPVFCCGEALEIREANKEVEFVTNQISESLFHLDAQAIQKCIIAYEPIWAIGTGLTASADQAESMHAEIRQHLTAKFGSDIAQNISILYGGSCNENNAKELFSCPNVDGGLIGGAALKADSFKHIIKSF